MRNFAKRDGARRCIPKLLTLMLLAFAALPTLSNTQTINVCDRTPEVRHKILQALEADVDDCAAVDSVALARIDSLFIFGGRGSGGSVLTTLRPDDFAGLTGLEVLAIPMRVFPSIESLFDFSSTTQGTHRLGAAGERVCFECNHSPQNKRPQSLDP